MKTLIFSAISTLFFMGMNASAATVQVDWTGAPPSSTATNVWNYSQNGFDVTALTLLGGGIPVQLGDLTTGGGLPVNPATQYSFTRSGGGSFDLTGMDLGAAYSGYATIIDRHIGGFGGTVVSQVLPYFWNAIKLVGIHTDGSVLTNTFSPWNMIDTSGPATFSYPAKSKAGNNLFGQLDFGTNFNDLVSLTISLVDPTITSQFLGNSSDPFGADFQNSYFCDQQQLNQYDPALGIGSLCAGGATSDEYSFFLSRLGTRNDNAALSINSFTFNTVPIAVVPVPASLPMLAGALALFGVLRGRSKRA